MQRFEIDEEHPLDIVRLEPHKDRPGDYVGWSLLGCHDRRIIFFNDPEDQTEMGESDFEHAVVWIEAAKKPGTAEARLVEMCESGVRPMETLRGYYAEFGAEIPDEYDQPARKSVAPSAGSQEIWRPGEKTGPKNDGSGDMPETSVYEHNGREFEIVRGRAYVWTEMENPSEGRMPCVKYTLVTWPVRSVIVTHPVVYYGAKNLFENLRTTPRGCTRVIWQSDWVMDDSKGHWAAEHFPS